eukprot:3626614-Amphidinium_carterae.1
MLKTSCPYPQDAKESKATTIHSKVGDSSLIVALYALLGCKRKTDLHCFHLGPDLRSGSHTLPAVARWYH